MREPAARGVRAGTGTPSTRRRPATTRRSRSSTTPRTPGERRFGTRTWSPIRTGGQRRARRPTARHTRATTGVGAMSRSIHGEETNVVAQRRVRRAGIVAAAVIASGVLVGGVVAGRIEWSDNAARPDAAPAEAQ